MAKEDIKKMIDNLEAGDNVGASDAFNAAMIDHQKDAIEAKRLDVQLAVSYTHLTLPTKA